MPQQISNQTAQQLQPILLNHLFIPQIPKQNKSNIRNLSLIKCLIGFLPFYFGHQSFWLAQNNLKVLIFKSEMQLTKSSPASTPTLAFITNCINTIPRTRYVIYYQIPLFKLQYKPIQSLHHQELLITNSVLLFKILDLQKPQEPPLFKEANFIFKDTNVSLQMSFMQEYIKLSGSIINKAEKSEGVKAIGVSEIDGYAVFMTYRRKYRMIENITRKQEFTLDHRLKITTGGSVFYFALEQGDLTQHFFNNNRLFVEIEEVYCSGEWKKIQSIMEQDIELAGQSQSLAATINIMDKLKITLKIEHVNNSNYSNSQLASLRILQATPLCGNIIIGTDQVKQLASVSPLLGDEFYDYEFGYLSQNIKETGGQVYEHIDKLTKSFPNYPHLKNGKIINISGSKYLNFTLDQAKSPNKNVSIPFIYLLFGYNSIQTETQTIKFYIQFTGTNSHPAEQKQSKHRIYQLKIKDIWNLGEISKKYNNFTLKIITPGLTYSIPFFSEQVQSSAWKSKAKQLQNKEQQSQLSGSKYYVLTKSSGGKLLLTKTESIRQFFLLDLYSSSSITFQIVSSYETVLQGTILRQSLTTSSPSVPVTLTLSSPNNSLQTILLFTLNQVSQNHQSNRTFYKFMYKLQFIDNIPSDQIQYDLEVKRLSDGKKYRSKIGPEMANDGLSTLHMFEGGFFEAGHQDIEIGLSLRKMYYNEQTEIFDNSQAIHKNICINQAPSQNLVEKLRQKPVQKLKGKNVQAKSEKHNDESVSVYSSKQIKENSSNLSEKNRDQSWLIKNITEEGYTSVEIDFYDENIKKRLRLYFEIIMRKLPLLDIKKGKYIIKVPSYLWTLNNLNFPANSERETSMQVHLSTKKRKTEKVHIFSDSPQQYILPQFNYNDGIQMNINGEIGYDKMIDAIKLKCYFTKKQLTWTEDSDEYFAVLNVGEFVFYFIVKFQQDTSVSGEDSDGSRKSNRTASKRNSETSNSQKIDTLAKTINFSEVMRLKQIRNKQVQKNRKKTAQFVRHQEMIIKYKRKIQQVEEAIAKRDYKQPTYSSHITQGKQKDSAHKIKQLYKTLCQCGSKEIMFNGFCENCLKQLRKSYSTYFKQYQEIAEVYERIHFNKFQAKEKYLKVKNKYKLYKERLSLGQDIEQNDLGDVIKNMEQSDLRRKIEENKILLFRLQAERQKLQDSSKVRMASLEDLIRKEDSQIWQQTVSMEQCKQELLELNQAIKKQKKK